MEGGGLLRNQAGKGGRHRFHISIFGFRVSDFEFRILCFSLIEILLIDQKVGNNKWSKTEGIFCTQYLNLFT